MPIDAADHAQALECERRFLDSIEIPPLERLMSKEWPPTLVLQSGKKAPIIEAMVPQRVIWRDTQFRLAENMLGEHFPEGYFNQIFLFDPKDERLELFKRMIANHVLQQAKNFNANAYLLSFLEPLCRGNGWEYPPFAPDLDGFVFVYNLYNIRIPE